MREGVSETQIRRTAGMIPKSPAAWGNGRSGPRARSTTLCALGPVVNRIYTLVIEPAINANPVGLVDAARFGVVGLIGKALAILNQRFWSAAIARISVGHLGQILILAEYKRNVAQLGAGCMNDIQSDADIDAFLLGRPGRCAYAPSGSRTAWFR